MTYKPTSALPIAVAFALWSAGAAHADGFTDAVIERYQELGFDYIEVKEGVSQLKVEAIRGSQKYEVIYDRESGRILKQETEAAEANEIGRSGVEIDREGRDFLDSDDIDDESDDDENDESDEGDESDDEEGDESDESDESDDDESDESDDDESDDDESDESDESDSSDESDESGESDEDDE